MNNSKKKKLAGIFPTVRLIWAARHMNIYNIIETEKKMCRFVLNTRWKIKGQQNV